MKVFSALALALALLSSVDGGRVKVKGSKPPPPAYEKEVRISSVVLCASIKRREIRFGVQAGGVVRALCVLRHK